MEIWTLVMLIMMHPRILKAVLYGSINLKKLNRSWINLFSFYKAYHRLGMLLSQTASLQETYFHLWPLKGKWKCGKYFFLFFLVLVKSDEMLNPRPGTRAEITEKLFFIISWELQRTNSKDNKWSEVEWVWHQFLTNNIFNYLC